MAEEVLHQRRVRPKHPEAAGPVLQFPHQSTPPFFMVWQGFNVKPLPDGRGVDAMGQECCGCEHGDKRSTLTHKTIPPPPPARPSPNATQMTSINRSRSHESLSTERMGTDQLHGTTQPLRGCGAIF